MRASSLSDMIAAGYHERTLSAASFDTQYTNQTHIRALAVEDALQRGYFLDPKARELEDYILTLECQVNWSQLCAIDGVVIDMLKESRYGDMPVIRVRLHFDKCIRLTYLLAMLENPDVRAKWDYSLQQMSVLYVAEENYYIRNSVVWMTYPLKCRETLERCQVREVDGDLRMVYYSISHPHFPPKPESLRAITAFGMLQFKKTNMGVSMTLISQMATLHNTHMDLDAEVQATFDWLERLQREVELSTL